jgi:hypothetical protein
MAGKYLRGLQYSSATNGRDIPIFMKFCYEFWAYCVNGTNTFLSINAASFSNPITITTTTPHGLANNQFVGVYNVGGNTNANGGWTVTVVNTTQFNLNGAVGNATYTPNTGTVVIPGGVPISPTSSPAGFFEGSSVLAIGNDGVTSSIGSTLTAAASTPFSANMVNKHVVVWLAGAATGITQASVGQSLPQSSINVASTIGFVNSGTLFVETSSGLQTVTYAGIVNTTIAAGSNGQTLPQATINVISTTGFPNSGTINVTTAANTPQVVTYTGKTPTSFTGCSGGTGAMTTTNPVTGQIFTGCVGGTGTMLTNGSVSVNQPSTDDSIYKIIAVPSTTQLQLVPFSGGTPDISTLKNNLTSRASLSYRVIDVVAASQLAIASGNYFIGTLNGAPAINDGQAPSQFQFLLRGTSTPFGQFGMVGSPNGSWNGSVFSGTGSSTTMTERTNANGLNFTGTTANAPGFITMFADTDFFFGHVHNATNSNGGANAKAMYFMATIPTRLYLQAQDPNLLAIMVGGNALNTSTGVDSLATSFGMVGFDGVTRTHQLISRNLVGDSGNNSTGANYTVGFNLSVNLGYQNRIGQVMTGDALMAVSSTAGQFSFARSRMRPLKFTFGTLPSFFLVGNSGEFIHLVNGILLPWDGAIMPYNILAGGL